MSVRELHHDILASDDSQESTEDELDDTLVLVGIGVVHKDEMEESFDDDECLGQTALEFHIIVIYFSSLFQTFHLMLMTPRSVYYISTSFSTGM